MLTECANLLASEINVTIVTAFQGGKQDYYHLDKKVRRIDLDVDDSTNNTFLFNRRKRAYERKLADFLNHEHFNIVVSLGGLESLFLYKIKDGSRKILWFHFSFNISDLFIREAHNGIFADILVRLHTMRRIYYARKMDKIVVLSKADAKKWKQYCNNVTYIYNPITIGQTGISRHDSNRVISVGALACQKGYDFLIDAWKTVSEKHSDWSLDIFGDGPDREVLQRQIVRNELQNYIFLHGKTNEIELEYCSHAFYVMSSRAEGFPLVLIEAASCALPLISYDCSPGIKEIIDDKENGIIIDEVGNVKELANAINYMIEHPILRDEMGKKTKEMSRRFEGDAIMKQWMKLFITLTKES